MRVIAIAAGANPLLTKISPDIKLSNRSCIIAEPESGEASKRGVWTGDDIVSGHKSVIFD